MNYFNCGKFSLPLGEKTYIMGILNITPDSFSDGGLWENPEKAAAHINEMIKAGADIIDIGAQSTRPGHIPVSAEEEIKRLSAVFDLMGEVSVPLSIDTYYPEAAEYSLKRGADIINDVSGVFNPEMAAVVKKYNAGWVVMHTGGGDADKVPEYKNGVIADINEFFNNMVEECGKSGIDFSRVCLDPGIGFGKTNEENLRIIEKMSSLKKGNCALLAGASRKRVIGAATGVEKAGDRVIGTVAAHCLCIAGGADIIRVHDVAEAKESALMCDAVCRRK